MCIKVHLQMPANVFVSYDHDDRDRVNGFKGLIYSPTHPLYFHDWSLKDPIVDKIKKPLPYPPSDERSKPIKKEIKRLFKKASRMIVLVGEYTNTSEWVNWEIQTFFVNKESIGDGKAQNRIKALRFKGYDEAKLPPNLKNRSGESLNWNLRELLVWLDSDI